MFARYRLGLLSTVLVVLTVTVVSCNSGKIKTAGQIQNEKMDESMAAYGAHHDQMVDNAVLQNMALVDFHFVAHTPELSGTGAATLDRMAPYLSTYGGTVRYETYDPNAELIAERMDHVREYLTLSGCDMSRVEVKQMISGGRGIAARDAITVKEKGTANANAQGGGALGGAMQAPPSGSQGAP